MADEKVEQTNQQPAGDTGGNTPPPPEWHANVPEKFRRATEAESLAAMAEAYKNLEKTLSQKNTPKMEIGGDSRNIDPNADLPSVIAAAGLDAKAVLAEFSQKGTLTEDQYKALEKVGFNRAAVNITGKAWQKAQEAEQVKYDAVVAEAVALTGSKDDLQALLNQAPTLGYTKTELDALQARLNDAGTFMGVVHELRSKAGIGKPAPVTGGVRGGPSAVDPLKAINRAVRGDGAAIQALASVSLDDIRGRYK